MPVNKGEQLSIEGLPENHVTPAQAKREGWIDEIVTGAASQPDAELVVESVADADDLQAELAPEGDIEFASPIDSLKQAQVRAVPTIDRSVKYYLSGPMTGYPDFNFPAFEKAAEVLRYTGIDIVSAHEVDHGEHTGAGTTSWENYLRGDLLEMLAPGVGGIILLKGWPQSSGAMLEFQIAQKLGYHVWYFDNFTLVDMNKGGWSL